MHDTKLHPHRVILATEMKEAGVIKLTIKMEGCTDFLEISLFNIFFTIYERDSDLFFKVMDKFMEAASKIDPFGEGDLS